MSANTEKGRRVREYYISMEEVLFEFTRRNAVKERERFNATIEEANKDAEEARALVAAKDAELSRFKTKAYEEVPKEDKVYICKEASELNSDRHKIGKAIDTKKRESQLNTGSAQGSKIIFEWSTLNAKLIEDIAYMTLKRYHCAREHYNSRIPKLDNVYVNKEVAELAGDAHKVGKAVDPKKRESQLNTGSAQGSRMIYKRPTHNAKVVEDILKVAQRRYHIASIGGWEHYNNNVEHSVDVIDIAATVVDTLASSFEYMKRGALFKKVIANLHAVQEEDEVDDDDTNLKESLEQEVANTRNKLHEFLAMDNDHRSSSSTSQTYSISRVPGSITNRIKKDVIFESP
ncbi:hypothetical protein TSOC_010044 [Tetrabaena socialis]|uniref:Uncharacterized protein n=1 Tax=Tetrabaena socialis TaxID=47790 RepID=A0A2J7ZUA5_9CHLO|nr:hypothetical protein TSOC_010044 [Tetrabaena socialis]|eukprot:PNH03857.1 hypothetical protein TSOC_010044 [Tetrabaena socialis]